MYVADFDAFYAQAEQLFRSRPLDTRYSVKYRNCDGKLVIKVTDDRTCLKYKTDQQSDLKRLERLNTLFFALMSKGEGADPNEFLQQQQQQQQQQPAAAAQQPPPSAGKKSRRKG